MGRGLTGRHQYVLEYTYDMANRKDTQPERNITVRVPSDLADQFAEAVRQDDLDVSKVIRRYMRDYVARSGLRAAA